ncbi:putative peptidyl-tRNA hydrolase [Planoprotostelium fungivorum]|uniref:peptidyl-tRNA hydrolase n=1 Tax=Planoprotostelium fungivorum TaxID=1890364 RepID=A0A2P6NAK3_9EUKA|nr:putative peptidyl-tRNA hydrolase [Planoprotostelium fungivorum]
MSTKEVLVALGLSVASFGLGWQYAKRTKSEDKKVEKKEEEEEEEEYSDDEYSDDDDFEYIESEDEDDNEEYIPHKMLFIVRTDLKMGAGKVAAQVGHATLGGYKRAIQIELIFALENRGAVKMWSSGGQAKIAVKIPRLSSTYSIRLAIRDKAEELGISHYIVMDAGRTQVASGSKTVMALGPDSVEKIDSITRHLKLL